MRVRKDLDERQVRLQKLQELREKGIAPFGDKFDRTDVAKDLVEEFSYLEKGEKIEGRKAKVAGRIMAIRRHGKACFADIKDVSGKKRKPFYVLY